VSELARTVVGIFAALAPFGALPAFLVYARHSGEGANGPRFALLSSAAAFAILVATALVATPLLDLLNISAENFQFAAGAIMAPLAIRLLLTGDSMAPPADSEQHSRLSWLLPVAFPLLAGPPAIGAAMAFAGRYDEGTAIAGAAVAIAATVAVLATGDYTARWLRPIGLNALGRMSGALLVVVAVELAIDGVRSV
jgi:small neutral amino acid transporter SnatA (MarC family)